MKIPYLKVMSGVTLIQFDLKYWDISIQFPSAIELSHHKVVQIMPHNLKVYVKYYSCCVDEASIFNNTPSSYCVQW